MVTNDNALRATCTCGANNRKERDGVLSDVIWNADAFDNLHFTWDRPLSYGKTWNFAVGQRESGKSVDSWVHLYNAFHYCGRPSIVLRRRIADISTAYIDDVATLLNKFLLPEHQVQVLYLKGDVSSGIADIKIGKLNQKYNYNEIKALPTFFRIIGLSCPMNRIKSMVLRDVKYIFFDEFIANTRGGEKYLNGDEHFLISEIFTTYNREASTPIRILCAGNPYSVYCPLFTGLGADSSKLKPGAFVTGPDYVVDCFQVGSELKAKILAANPMYQFDDTYERYAFGGEAINDANIAIHKTEPKGFKLRVVFKMGNQYVSLHSGRAPTFRYWACSHNKDWVKKLGKRKIIVFNFQDMCAGTVRWHPDAIGTFRDLKDAMYKGQATFNTIDAFYMMEDVISVAA